MNPRWSEELITQLGAEDGSTRQRARETLAAIGEPVIAKGDEYIPTPVVSHAIVTHNRGRKSGLFAPRQPTGTTLSTRTSATWATSARWRRRRSSWGFRPRQE
jgi:hypothetical protein